MENLMLKIRTAMLILAAVAANGAYAMGPSGSSADYGVEVADTTAARTIVVTPQTRWVNVTNGETVKFAVGDKTFNWHVDTYTNVNAFELAKISPNGIAAAGVQVYVAPRPTDLN
jgi:Heavy-metal resistance protein CzcE